MHVRDQSLHHGGDNFSASCNNNNKKYHTHTQNDNSSQKLVRHMCATFVKFSSKRRVRAHRSMMDPEICSIDNWLALRIGRCVAFVVFIPTAYKWLQSRRPYMLCFLLWQKIRTRTWYGCCHRLLLWLLLLTIVANFSPFAAGAVVTTLVFWRDKNPSQLWHCRCHRHCSYRCYYFFRHFFSLPRCWRSRSSLSLRVSAGSSFLGF